MLLCVHARLHAAIRCIESVVLLERRLLNPLLLQIPGSRRDGALYGNIVRMN